MWQVVKVNYCKNGVNLDLTYTRLLWYMTTMPNMNTIQRFMYEISQKIHNSNDKIGICTLIWYPAKAFFMFIKLLSWMITVANMIKIHWFIHYITTNMQHLCNNGCKCYIWEIIFYTYHAHIVVDYCTNMIKINPSFLRSHNKYIKCMNNIALITQYGMGPNAIIHASVTHGVWLLYQT